MPRLASSNFPVRFSCASVNAPLTCPKSSLSKRVSLTAPISTVTISSLLRSDMLCILRAISSFPVPFSPVIIILVLVLATLSTVLRTWVIASELPTICLSSLFMLFIKSFSFCFNPSISIFERLSSMADFTVASSFWLSQGFSTKSVAPAFSALTASSTSP